MKSDEILEQAQELIYAESEALRQVAELLDDSFVDTVNLVSTCTGRVLVTGAGTSGTIARRLSHLLATCGVPAFFAHPADTLHGPAALISSGDVLIAFSKAGKSAEINELARITKRRGGSVVGWTWEPESELGQISDIVCNINSGVEGEGEGVLPFGSTLAAGAAADALCLMVKRLTNFDLGELAETHPSGATAELVKK